MEQCFGYYNSTKYCNTCGSFISCELQTKENSKTSINSNFCSCCEKEQTEIEIITGQCNDCDPFTDADELIELFGEPDYEF